MNIKNKTKQPPKPQRPFQNIWGMCVLRCGLSGRRMGSEPCRHKCLLLKCWLPPRHFPRLYAYLLLGCIPSSCSFANCIEYSADSHGKTSLLRSLLQPVVPTPPEDYSDFLFQAGTVWRQISSWKRQLHTLKFSRRTLVACQISASAVSPAASLC